MSHLVVTAAMTFVIGATADVFITPTSRSPQHARRSSHSALASGDSRENADGSTR